MDSPNRPISTKKTLNDDMPNANLSQATRRPIAGGKKGTMKLMIEVKMDNAAFQDNDTELYEMLGRVAMAVQDGEKGGNLRDSNGNTVGRYKVTGK